jgi:hypothetical protein
VIDIIGLIGPDFFAEYGRVAGELSVRYGVAAVPLDERWDVLNQYHEDWKGLIYREFVTGYRTYESQWQRILHTLSVCLCRCHAVDYVPLEKIPRNLERYQSLLIENPGIFTGLKFIRDQYLGVLSHEQVLAAGDNVRRTPPPRRFAFVETVEFESAIRHIQRFPDDAGDFISLLKLPVRNPRSP